MRKMIAAALVAGLCGTASMTTSASAESASVTLADSVPTTFVQYRHDRGGYHGGPRYYGPRYHGRWHRGYGNAAAAGAVGLAAGALLGAAIAGQAQAAPPPPPAVVDPQVAAYCARRYRSFDPVTGTFLASSGERLVCTYP